MKSKCCRSLPRCANCPVVLAAASRRQRQLDPSAALITSVLGGSRPPLARCVEDALAQLDAARAAAREPALAHALPGT
ncbi:MAG TPA: hypothetical protein VFR97_09145 [Capillimicrobium sp.]|nr:hypothetical protein [Capillimicrobium sp.]